MNNFDILFFKKKKKKQIPGTCESSLMFKTLLFSNFLYMALENFYHCICHFPEKFNEKIKSARSALFSLSI
jgi:hypothetical protein